MLAALPAALLTLALLIAPTTRPAVDRTTLHGKIMAGYQGWFNAPGDDSQRGWVHWARNGGMRDGNATVELWPDVSEYENTYDTALKHADGSVAKVFSSHDKQTVLKHFEWMQTYGLDGVFVQRFMLPDADTRYWDSTNQILEHCREGADTYGRAYAVMYDLSGLGEGETRRVAADWQRLREERRVTEDAAYLHHSGKPLVVVWGIGFADDRKYTLAECMELVKDLQAGGCTVMIGVPSYWREGGRDAMRDPLLKQIVEQVDLVSPWTVGRYDSPEAARQHARDTIAADLQWTAERGTELMPVVFPGFSWHNLHDGPLNQIPRRMGAFLWSQITADIEAGAGMIYVAMFDEVDEATAIFKCTNEPPVGEASRFIDYEGLPSDFYLRLVGAAGEVLRGDREATPDVPADLMPGE